VSSANELAEALRRAELAEEAENEAKDCFWAIYHDYLEMGGKPISTEAARTNLAGQVISMRDLLGQRDKFIVDHGLWEEFVKSLP